MRVGVADHLGWAVVVTASAGHEVVDRRRVELVEPGVPTMPVHHHGEGLDDRALGALVAEVRASAQVAAAAAFDELEAGLDESIESVSIRRWPADFPTDVQRLRVAPYEARADGVMYRQVLAEVGRGRGWTTDFYDAKTVLDRAAEALGDRADEVLVGPRRRLGPPWAKDHRIALAATVLAG